MSGGARKGRPRARFTSGSFFRGSTRRPYRRSRRRGKSKGKPSRTGRQPAGTLPNKAHVLSLNEGRDNWTATCTCGWQTIQSTRHAAKGLFQSHRGVRIPKEIPKPSLRRQKTGWTAVCDCGWNSRTQPLKSAAADAAEIHWRKFHPPANELSSGIEESNTRRRNRAQKRLS